MKSGQILTSQGKSILKTIVDAAKKNGLEDCDLLEATMLANSFDLYFQAAEFVQKHGVKQTFVNDKGIKYSQVCPEYSVMKTEYANVLKHSGKFGLNPADRKKIFSKVQKKKAPFG